MTPHGGRLIAAQRRWPDAPLPWIDLSTGINPAPYPVHAPADSWTRLPEPEQERALTEAAAQAYGAPPECVVAAPGSSALIALLPRLLGSEAAVLAPTYGEYRVAWPRAVEAASLSALRQRPVRVVCRPNNPDGRCDPADAVLGLAQDGWLVVDAAFADFEPADRQLPHAQPAPTGEGGLVVLRSFGKAYGLAGLRLGFAVAPARLALEMRRALGPWAVSGPAIAVGAAALRDEAWRAAAGARLAADAARFDALLRRAGMTVVGGTTLFRLADCDAARWHERLARRGILTRLFPDQPRWLRFGIPAAWDRLEQALTG